MSLRPGIIPSRRTTSRRLVGIFLAITLLTGCQPGSTTTAAPSPTGPAAPASATPAPATPTPGTATAPGLTAPQRLTTLAATITAAPGDHTTDLPYTYLHTQSWARATNHIRRLDLRQWRHQKTGSGREITRRLPDLPGLRHQPTPTDVNAFADAPAHQTRHSQGLAPYLPEPLPTDPTVLAAALAPPALAHETAYPRLLANGIVALATHQYLTQQDRAATLRILATIPGIRYEGENRDPAGRTGLTFTVTADHSTCTLTFNPTTGELLAAQETITQGRPGLMSAVLILHRGHTTTDNQPPPNHVT
ncbi:hypothetical protein AB0M35_27910 [Micromonospora sp. NPDC051196]|uniref:hypothetical protein n=1 Tax=Micromonospora sp. NPDC051196 TaxID=3155281 RepID=UPI00344726DB